MAISNTNARKVKPTHPGEMLREDFMPDYGLTITTIAEKLGVSRQTVNELLNEHRSVSPAMALRLSRLFGNSPEFWLAAQLAVDLWEAQRNYKKELSHIHMLKAA
ncbi:MAG: HigA family addiction module antidote protein [Deltaproteobacteria bacterium]|nr:HigA family addiction module antidote protein [Deltaproteobacteria bacterium]